MTPPKPHRVLLDRVSAYADEGAAYLRRRRAARRPFARLYYQAGHAEDHASDSVAGGELFVAAGRLFEVCERGTSEDPSPAQRERAKRDH
jgi:hypothetical protein